MKKQRIIAFALALLILVSLLPLSAVPAKAAANVELEVWMDQYCDQWLYNRVEEFNAQSSRWNISVTLTAHHVGETGNLALQDPDNVADVYIFGNDQLGVLVDAGLLMPMSGTALAQVQADNAQTMIESVTATDGKVYGIPYTGNTWFMYYDKSVFSESDIKNLETMLKKGRVAFPLTNSWYLPAFYFANGCTMFGEDGLDAEAGIDFHNEKGIAVTKYLVDLLENPNFLSDETIASQLLNSGRADAVFSGSWEAQGVRDVLGANFGAAQLPTVTIDGKTKQLKAFAGSKALGVNPNSENAEAALALAAFLGNRESQIQRYEAVADVPACPELESRFTDAPAVRAQLMTIANTAVIQPTISRMNAFWDPAANLGRALADGEITRDNAAEAIANYTKDMNGGMLITAHPKAASAKDGEKVSASVKAEGDGLTYTWYIKNAGASRYSKSSITKSTYSVTMAEKADGRRVYCVVTDDKGNTLRSRSALLTMTEDLQITKQPATAYAKSGAKVTASVEAKGTGLKYTWYVKNAGATKYSKSSVTKSSYSVTMTDKVKDRLVYCVVSDSSGDSVKSNTVRLRMAATVTKQPASVTVAKGETAKVYLTAVGDGLTYKWYWAPKGSDDFQRTTAFTGRSYSVSMNASRDGRQVYCVVTDKYGNKTKSRIATLNME